MDILVSIIVPVFNVEPYLGRCLDSIISQTYSNIEIIVVDDGSTDSSRELCDLYSDKDNRIKVIHKTNRGLSSARNAGIDIASGDYLMFIDSDDWINPETVEEALNIVKRYEADLVIFDLVSVNDDGRVERIPNKFPLESNWSKMDFWNYYYSAQYLKCCVSWNKLYHRKLFEILRFREGVLHEDEFILFDVISQSASIWYINQPLYNYFQRKGSIMKSPNVKNYSDAIWAFAERLQNFSNDLFSKFIPDTIETAISCYIEGMQLFRKKEGKRLLNSAFRLLGKANQRVKHYLNTKYKIKLFIARNLPSLYFYFILFKKKFGII